MPEEDVFVTVPLDQIFLGTVEGIIYSTLKNGVPYSTRIELFHSQTKQHLGSLVPTPIDPEIAYPYGE